MSSWRDAKDWVTYRSAESREMKWALILIGALIVAGIVGCVWFAVTYWDEPKDSPVAEEVPVQDGESVAVDPDVAAVAALPADDDEPEFPMPIIVLMLASMASILCMGAIGIFKLMRQGGTKFSELPDDEKARRREAAESLRRLSEP